MDLKTRRQMRRAVPTHEVVKLWAENAEISEWQAAIDLSVIVGEGRLPIHYRNGDTLPAGVMAAQLSLLGLCRIKRSLAQS